MGGMGLDRVDVTINTEFLKEMEIIFNHLEEANIKLESLFINSEKPLESFNYLCQQWTHCIRFTMDSEMEADFPNLKKQLLNTLLDKMSYEINILLNYCLDCKKILELVRTKFDNIIKMQMDLNDYGNGTVVITTNLEGVIQRLSGLWNQMRTAVGKARILESQIDKSAFCLTKINKQYLGRTIEIHKFYAGGNQFLCN